ncbi:armadillo-type protein [Cladochytrium replicatum]|nr:armadillo-type protein [Cladochytrium replicatum]
MLMDNSENAVQPMDVDSGPNADRLSLPKELSAVCDEIMRSLQRDINILGENLPDRMAKRRALDKIRKETLGPGAQNLDERVLSSIFRVLLKPLCRCFSDPVEKVRDLSINLVRSYAPRVTVLPSSMHQIMTTVSARLAQQEIIEPSEENRLLLIHLMTELADLLGPKSGEGLRPFADEYIRILLKTLVDPYPEIRKESCRLIVKISSYAPKALSYAGDAVPKALLASLVHRHSSVRIEGLQALTSAILVDLAGLDAVLETLHALAEDKHVAVRGAVHAVVGRWLRELVDRYMVGYKLLPILYSGMEDDVVQVREACAAEMDRAGALYEIEWVDRVKDELDYDTEHGSGGRPRVGSRHLARDNTMKIVEAAISGLQNWNADVRARWARVLCTLIRFTEVNVTGYTAQMLPALFRVCASDEVHVVKAARRVAELHGRYVAPEIYLEVAIPQLRTGGGGTTTYRTGVLLVVSSLLRGSTSASSLDSPLLAHRPLELVLRMPVLVDALRDREIVGNENMAILKEVAGVVLEVVGAVLAVAGRDGAEEDVGRVRFGILVVLVQLLSVRGDQKVRGFEEMRSQAEEALKMLEKSFGSSETAMSDSASSELFKRYFCDLLSWLAESRTEWTSHHVLERATLMTVLNRAGPLAGEPDALGKALDVILGMSTETHDLEVREGALVILENLLRNPQGSFDSRQLLHNYVPSLLRDAISPALVWKAGLKAQRYRGHALSVFHRLVSGGEIRTRGATTLIGYIPVDVLARDGKQFKLLTKLAGCLEEDEGSMRLESASIVGELAKGSNKWDSMCGKDTGGVLLIEGAEYKVLYVELMKRLDDAKDEIRVEAAKALGELVKAIGAWEVRMVDVGGEEGKGKTAVVVEGQVVDVRLDEMHWEQMVKGMAVHMDDTNVAIQESVRDALCAVASVSALSARVANDYLASVRHRHRSSVYIDQVVVVADHRVVQG